MSSTLIRDLDRKEKSNSFGARSVFREGEGERLISGFKFIYTENDEYTFIKYFLSDDRHKRRLSERDILTASGIVERFLIEKDFRFDDDPEEAFRSFMGDFNEKLKENGISGIRALIAFMGKNKITIFNNSASRVFLIRGSNVYPLNNPVRKAEDEGFGSNRKVPLDLLKTELGRDDTVFVTSPAVAASTGIEDLMRMVSEDISAKEICDKLIENAILKEPQSSHAAAVMKIPDAVSEDEEDGRPSRRRAMLKDIKEISEEKDIIQDAEKKRRQKAAFIAIGAVVLAIFAFLLIKAFSQSESEDAAAFSISEFPADAWIGSHGAVLYESAKGNAAMKADLPKGTRITITGSEKERYKVILQGTGQEGFLEKKSITLSRPNR